MPRVRAPILAWLLMPILLLPGGLNAMLCLASLGIANPCAECEASAAARKSAQGCCAEHRCQAAKARSPDDGDLAARVGASDPCDCCIDWDLEPRPSLPHAPHCDFPAPATYSTPIAEPCADARRGDRGFERSRFGRGPPSTPLPLRI